MHARVEVNCKHAIKIQDVTEEWSSPYEAMRRVLDHKGDLLGMRPRYQLSCDPGESVSSCYFLLTVATQARKTKRKLI